MTIPQDSTPKWDATISEVNIKSGSENPMSVKQDDYLTLADTIKDFVNTTSFQEALKSFSSENPLKIRVTIESDRLTIVNLADNKELLTTTPDKASEFQKTIESVNTFANTYLKSQKTSPKPLETTTQTSETLKTPAEEYGVHGISNGKNYCYANSAYQIVSNVTSLKEALIDTLPEKSPLKDYSNMKSGEQLLKAINDPKVIFKDDQQHDAGEALDAFVEKGTNFSTQALLTATQLEDANDSTSNYDTEKPEKLTTLGLTLPQSNNPEELIDFKNILSQSLTRDENPEVIEPNTTVLSTKTKFTEAPKHLFMRVGRFVNTNADKTKDSRKVDFPKELDLNTYGAMAKGAQATPLYLKAFTVHQGDSYENGHYFACFQKSHPTNPGEFQWFKADDNNIQAISEEQALELSKEASDVYYDNEGPLPKSTTTAITTSVHPEQEKIKQALEIIRNLPQTISEEQKEEVLSIHTQLLSQEEQTEIASAIGKKQKENQYALTKFINYLRGNNDKEAGEIFIFENPDSKIFLEKLKSALENKIKPIS